MIYHQDTIVARMIVRKRKEEVHGGGSMLYLVLGSILEWARPFTLGGYEINKSDIDE